jgi:hypothetical protein
MFIFLISSAEIAVKKLKYSSRMTAFSSLSRQKLKRNLFLKSVKYCLNYLGQRNYSTLMADVFISGSHEIYSIAAPGYTSNSENLLPFSSKMLWAAVKAKWESIKKAVPTFYVVLFNLLSLARRKRRLL